MKKVHNYAVIALLSMAMTATVTSCKDDDDDNSSSNGTEQRRDDADPMDTEQVHVATRWISALTSTDTLGTGWETASYEPTIGRVSKNNALTRLVVVADIEEAQAEFASMAGVDPSKLASTLTVSQAGVGSLTWTPSGEGAENLAVADVDIKQVPHLQKIVYCTEEQTGSNGLFSKNVTGTAYYRFGDVVRDRQGYYWVCVRPSFEIDDKGDSHWVNVFNAGKTGSYKEIPDANLQMKYNKKAKYNNVTYILPTKLSFERKDIYNLSNLLWALVDPDKYTIAAASNKGKGLGGFPFEYNGVEFIKRVADYWDEFSIDTYTVWELVFGHKRSEFDQLTHTSFFYKGYSWVLGSDATLWRYDATAYAPTYKGSEDEDWVKAIVSKGWDIRAFTESQHADKNTEAGFGSLTKTGGVKHGQWVVRTVTGDKLCIDGKYDPYKALTNATDIYVFNNKIGYDPKKKLLKDDDIINVYNANEGLLQKPVIGCILGSDGKFYKNLASAQRGDSKVKGPLGLVVCLNGNKVVETGTQFNGLAIALNLTDSVVWGEQSNSKCQVSRVDNVSQVSALLNGIAETRLLANGCNQNHIHPAAQKCADYNVHPTDEYRQSGNVSNWFLPSAGQWVLALKSMGLPWNDQTGCPWTSANYEEKVAYLDELETLVAAGMMNLNEIESTCYTTTQFVGTSIITMNFNFTPFSDGLMYGNYTTKRIARPFIAFKYNNQ